MVEAELIEQPGFLLERREVRGAIFRVQHASRMRLVGDHHAGGARLTSAGNQGLEQRLVPAMHTVEGAHGQMTGSQEPRWWEAEADLRHEGKTARG